METLIRRKIWLACEQHYNYDHHYQVTQELMIQQGSTTNSIHFARRNLEAEMTTKVQWWDQTTGHSWQLLVENQREGSFHWLVGASSEQPWKGFSLTWKSSFNLGQKYHLHGNTCRSLLPLSQLRDQWGVEDSCRRITSTQKPIIPLSLLWGPTYIPHPSLSVSLLK